MEEAIRAFVAVEIPDALRARCAEIGRRLAPAAGSVSWVKPGNLHLTLKFLGNTTPAQIDRLAESLAHKAAKLRAGVARGKSGRSGGQGGIFSRDARFLSPSDTGTG
jgi:hypothetical protein